MWNHRNEVILQEARPNPFVLAKAHDIFFYTMIYNSKSNVISPSMSTWIISYKKSNKQINTQWTFESDKLEYFTSKLSNKNLTSIGLVCRDSNKRILHTIGKKLQNVPVLETEVIIIHEAFKTAALREMDNFMVENDFHVVIKSIEGQTNVPGLIINHVVDINNLVGVLIISNLGIVLGFSILSQIALQRDFHNSCMSSLLMDFPLKRKG